MVVRVRYQTRAAISVAKRCSLAALRLAAPSYGSIFGPKSELAASNTLALPELEPRRQIRAAVQRLTRLHDYYLDAIAAHQAFSA